MSYEEQRVVLREFEVRLSRWTRDYDPRFALGWAFDLGTLDWWQTGEGAEAAVRLRLTDRDLVASAAD